MQVECPNVYANLALYSVAKAWRKL